MKLDKSITIGHILTFIGFLIAGGGAYAGAMSEMRSVSLRLQIVEKQIESLPNVLVAASRQDERLVHIDTRLTRIENRIERIEYPSGQK